MFLDSTTGGIVKGNAVADVLTKKASNANNNQQQASEGNDESEINQKEDLNKKRIEVWRKEESLLDDVKNVLKVSSSVILIYSKQ